MDAYTIEMINRTLFSNEVIGEIQPANEWTSGRLEWAEENKNRRRTMQKNSGYEVLQGSGKAQGRLMGGCIEVLEFAKGTALWPEKKYWENSILFFETSEEKAEPNLIRYWLRNYAAQGILQQANGILFGKPQDEKYYNEYKEEIQKVMKEYDLENLPILYNLNFGHTEPKFILPYGAMAEIDCEKKAFTILESGVE
jgi:muramoyltetrapeptide carboxypeptidase LdcA involved in peptidoglycan recycling